MKLLLLLITTPLFLISCLFSDTDSNLDEESATTENETEDVEEEAEEEEEDTEPPEVVPINITSDAFISNFFSASYEYRTISLYSSYDYMVNTLGEPDGSGEITDGTYYHYEHIGFNFPEAADEGVDTSELQVDGIIIFPEEFSKMDAVENYGWPTIDDTPNFRMLYDGDSDNGYYVMMTYDQQDYINAIMLHNENFQDTSLSEDSDDED